jgi:hypothetical protein
MHALRPDPFAQGACLPGGKEFAIMKTQSLFLAYLTKYSKDRRPIVKRYDIADELEARQSASVVWTCSIEADSIEGAEYEAKAALMEGRGMITAGGMQLGFKFSERME